MISEIVREILALQGNSSHGHVTLSFTLLHMLSTDPSTVSSLDISILSNASFVSDNRSETVVCTISRHRLVTASLAADLGTRVCHLASSHSSETMASSSAAVSDTPVRPGTKFIRKTLTDADETSSTAPLVVGHGIDSASNDDELLLKKVRGFLVLCWATVTDAVC